MTKACIQLIALLGCLLLSACALEPIQTDRDKVVIKGAPEWVNSGSIMYAPDTETRLFRGVSSISLQGDMAMQKSVADEKSVAEVGHVLAKYLEQVANSYMTYIREEDGDIHGERIPNRTLEGAAAKRVKEGVNSQIDQAIERQFKQEVPKQLKEDIYRRVREKSSRKIKDSIAYQIEFSHELEEDIARQIKASVSRQILNTTGPNLSGARLTENWRDPETETLWSLSQLNLAYVKNIMTGAKDLNEDLKLYFSEHAESIYDRMLKGRDEDSFFFFGQRE